MALPLLGGDFTGISNPFTLPKMLLQLAERYSPET